MRNQSTLSTLFRLPVCPRCLSRRGIRWASTDAEAAPPVLAKIRNDLKTAMRAKDTARLNVLRSVITEATNASKGQSPVKTDLQVLAMLRKRRAASKAAAREFAEAKRDDLKLKQEAEIAVLDEYAGQVSTMSDDEIAAAVDEALKTFEEDLSKANHGLVMKELFKPGGRLKDKPVEKSHVAELVKTRLARANE